MRTLFVSPEEVDLITLVTLDFFFGASGGTVVVDATVPGEAGDSVTLIGFAVPVTVSLLETSWWILVFALISSAPSINSLSLYLKKEVSGRWLGCVSVDNFWIDSKFWYLRFMRYDRTLRDSVRRNGDRWKANALARFARTRRMAMPDKNRYIVDWFDLRLSRYMSLLRASKVCLFLTEFFSKWLTPDYSLAVLVISWRLRSRYVGFIPIRKVCP